jgi:hypothetical protein
MKVINLTEGMRFGIGVDGLTEEARATAIDFDAVVQGSDGQGGQFVTSDVRIIESQESLMESMNLSVAASVHYLPVGEANAKFSLAQQHSVNHYSLYILFSASVRNAPRHMAGARLTPVAAQAYRNDPEAFRLTYGDYFIDEVYSGGDFYGVFVFETFDETSRSALKTSLDMSIGNFMAGGDINIAFQNTIEEAKKRSSMQIRVVMAGGSGQENPTNMQELKELYRNFNKAVRDDPVDFKGTLKEFRYLPMPAGPSWAERAVRDDTIKECGKRIVEGIALRSHLDFILRYPEQFETPDIEKLKAAYRDVDALLPKLAARAGECSRDLSHCTLEGTQPVRVELPKRKEDAGDPLQVKWRDILDHDERAAPWVPEANLATPITKYARGPRGGRYKLFANANGPTGGIFWHPDLGAHVVYGAIFQEYLKRGHCDGPLGYPRTDEATIQGMRADGLDRISIFERGQLWWDQQTGKVSDQRPPSQIILRFDLENAGVKMNDVLKNPGRIAAHQLVARSAIRPR